MIPTATRAARESGIASCIKTSVITSKPAIHGHFKTGHMGARNVFFG
jgi:hypothetical protein